MVKEHELAEIYVHIGLPKTATTTLQRHVYPEWSAVDYLGTHLPRIVNRDPLYRCLTRYVYAESGDAGAIGEQLRDRLARSRRPLLLSEENLSIGAFPGCDQAAHPMFGTPFQTKMARLARLLGDTDFLIVVSLREFRKVVFSAYAEYVERIEATGWPAADCIRKADAFRVYHYHWLRAVLTEQFGDRIHPIFFDDAVRGDLRLPGLAQPKIDGPLPNARSHDKTAEGVVREADIRRPLLKLAISLRYLSPKLAERVWLIRRSRRVVVPFWTDAEWNDLQDLADESNRAMEQWRADVNSM